MGVEVLRAIAKGLNITSLLLFSLYTWADLKVVLIKVFIWKQSQNYEKRKKKRKML